MPILRCETVKTTHLPQDAPEGPTIPPESSGAAVAPASAENTPEWLHGWRQGMSDAAALCRSDENYYWQECEQAIIAARDARK